MTRDRQSAFQLTGDKHSDNRFLAMRIMALLGLAMAWPRLAARTMRRRLLTSSTAREADQSAQSKGRCEPKGYHEQGFHEKFLSSSSISKFEPDHAAWSSL